MKIAIKPDNADTIGTILENVAGRARTHTYIFPTEIANIIIDAEKKFAKYGIAKKYWRGNKIVARSGVPTSKSYARKGRTAIASEVRLERGSKDWFLVGVNKIDRWTGPGGDEKITITISKTAMENIVANLPFQIDKSQSD